MSEEKHKWDGYERRVNPCPQICKIDEISEVVNSTQQRLMETILPIIDKHDKALNGNGKKGLITIVEVQEEKIKDVNDRIDKIPKIVGFVVAGIGGAGALLMWLINLYFTLKHAGHS